MTVQVGPDDFSTDTSADYDGAGITVAGGTATLDEDGLALHQDATTGTELWMRVIIETVDGTNGGPAIGDGSGNGFIIMVEDSGANLRVANLVEYDTYTTYANNDNYSLNDVIGTTDRTKQHGITFDLTNDTYRIWDDVTADEPTAIDTWDGGGPDVTEDYGALGQTQDGNYFGYGSWNSGTPGEEITYFAAGNIAAAGGASSALAILGVG